MSDTPLTDLAYASPYRDDLYNCCAQLERENADLRRQLAEVLARTRRHSRNMLARQSDN